MRLLIMGPPGAGKGIACMAFVWLQLKVSWQWYVLIGSAITFIAGCLTSLTVERSAGEERD